MLPNMLYISWGSWRRRGRSSIGSLFIYGILRNYKLNKLPRLTLWPCNQARSWTRSSQAWAVHKTEQLSVFCVFCPDAMLAMPVMGKHSTWLNMKTVRFLQGCTGDVQLYCTQDRSSPETIRVWGCTDQGVTWLNAWTLFHIKLWVWYIDTQVTLHRADLAPAGFVTSTLALAKLDLCSLLPSHSSISVWQFSYQHDFSVSYSNLLPPHPLLLFSTLEKGLWLGEYSK